MLCETYTRFQFLHVITNNLGNLVLCSYKSCICDDQSSQVFEKHRDTRLMNIQAIDNTCEGQTWYLFLSSLEIIVMFVVGNMSCSNTALDFLLRSSPHVENKIEYNLDWSAHFQTLKYEKMSFINGRHTLMILLNYFSGIWNTQWHLEKSLNV